jgi:hypothetical protein
MMDHIGLGAGLAALAFWGFIAAVSVAGIWDGVRKDHRIFGFKTLF